MTRKSLSAKWSTELPNWSKLQIPSTGNLVLMLLSETLNLSWSSCLKAGSWRNPLTSGSKHEPLQRAAQHMSLIMFIDVYCPFIGLWCSYIFFSADGEWPENCPSKFWQSHHTQVPEWQAAHRLLQHPKLGVVEVHPWASQESAWHFERRKRVDWEVWAAKILEKWLGLGFDA